MEKNIANNLTKLITLQAIDIQIDDIVKLRGGLPHEVSVLENELNTLQKTVSTTHQQLSKLNETVLEKKTETRDKEALIQKYERQQMGVRNNREYDVITKEIELNKLDIQLAEKTIRTSYQQIEQSKNTLLTITETIQEKEKDLISKKEELTAIIAASEIEEQIFHKKREKIIEGLTVTLQKRYETIRNIIHNNIAVVTVKQNACGGCCIIIPPQTKVEIHTKNKIYTCEHCGRIIAAVEEEKVEE